MPQRTETAWTDETVIVTTTFATRLKDPRLKQAQATCWAATRLGVPVIVVDGSPIHDNVRMYLARTGVNGVTVVKQEEPGMGNSRRQAFRLGLGTGRRVIVWMEPEKYTLVPLLGECVKPVFEYQRDLVVPRRRDLESYPPYQAYSELKANELMAKVTRRPELDLIFGPRVMNRNAVRVFLDYTAEFAAKHGLDDYWGLLSFPVLDAINRGRRVGSVEVSYIHPPEQTARETGDPMMDAKRNLQLEQLVAGMTKMAGIIDHQFSA